MNIAVILLQITFLLTPLHQVFLKVLLLTRFSKFLSKILPLILYLFFWLTSYLNFSLLFEVASSYSYLNEALRIWSLELDLHSETGWSAQWLIDFNPSGTKLSSVNRYSNYNIFRPYVYRDYSGRELFKFWDFPIAGLMSHDKKWRLLLSNLCVAGFVRRFSLFMDKKWFRSAFDQCFSVSLSNLYYIIYYVAIRFLLTIGGYFNAQGLNMGATAPWWTYDQKHSSHYHSATYLYNLTIWESFCYYV